MIRAAITEDINDIIKLHLKSFTKNHFSTTFSLNMLQKYFNKLISFNNYNYVYYSDEDDILLGYLIAGSKTKEAVSKFIKENYLEVFYTLIKNPHFIFEKIVEILNHLSGKNKKFKSNCRLYLICVNNNYKGKGIGITLIEQLETQLRKDGLKTYGLSVRKDNREAIGFYDKNNFKIEFINSKSIFYYKILTED